MKVWDTFLFNDELDMLECRLATLDEVADRFVLCEGNITNAGDPRSSYYLENRERFAPWADRIVHVWATGLPTSGWECEFAKRRWIKEGLGDAKSSDLVLLSDVDEIPHPEAVRYLRRYNPDGFVRFQHKLYCFAVDWLHPSPWIGTIAAPFGRVDGLKTMQDMRQMRHINFQHLPHLPDNWHFSWIGGTEANWRKFDSAHDGDGQDEVIRQGLAAGNRFLRDGVHVTGVKLIAVEVDETWPAYIYERRCPTEWFRMTFAEAA